MKKIIRILATIVIIVFVFVGGLNFWKWKLRRPIWKADHKTILVSCRDLMRKYDHLNSSRTTGRTNEPISVGKNDKEFETLIPVSIRKMDPAYVSIRKDNVLICFSALPRIYLIAFLENAEEYGTVELIDGLWFYNGHRSNVEMERIKRDSYVHH